MFKRSADNNAEGAPAAKEQKTEPIPRQLKENCITLNFTLRRWEEIAPGSLYYLPLCQNPLYMFDAAMLKQLKKYKDIWETMEIISPKARVSNLIMLQDDLRVQNNTPTDATAFTQVVYMIQYNPTGMKNYFKLAHAPDLNNMQTTKTLTYSLKPQKLEGGIATQFVKLTNFETFENLVVLGAKATREGGFITGGEPSVDATTLNIKDPFIAPNSVTYAQLSGNLQAEDTTANFISPSQAITMAANTDKISFHKYGDEFNIPITTNLEGIHLKRDKGNDFTEIYDVQVKRDGKNYNYQTEWCYPSRNRPFLHRGTYYDADLEPMLKGRDFKPLSHTFLCMPPIKKPNGTLLGQRCSLLLEQHITIKYHISQGTFMDTIEDNALQTRQDNSVILRRNIYGKPAVVNPPIPGDEASVFCRKGSVGCKAIAFADIPAEKVQKLPCYDNSFKGLQQFLDTLNRNEFEKLFVFKSTRPGPCPTDIGVTTYVTSNTVLNGKNFQKIWETWIEGVNYNWLCFKFQEDKVPIIDGHYVYWVNSNGYELLRNGTDVKFEAYVHLHKEKFLELFFSKANTFCAQPVTKNAEEDEAAPIANLFFV